MNCLENVLARCQRVFEEEYWIGSTDLIYDYRTSLDHEHRFDHLPAPEEIARRFPNPCGWASGMEDSMLNNPVALSMYLDAGDAEMAYRMYRGMKLCGTVSRMPGMVVRSVHPGDGRSFFPESSRDQYTHYVHGLWEYYHSPFSDATTREEIRKLLTEVADHCEKYAVPEYGYTLPRADLDPVRTPVCKMWEVGPHEAARLPMFYMAAYDVSKDSHYLELCLRYAADAAEQSNNLHSGVYKSFAIMQMLLSCRLLYSCLTEPALRARYLDAMEDIYHYSFFNLLQCSERRRTADLYAAPENWRKISRCRVYPETRHTIPVFNDAYDMAFQTMREIGEVMLIALFCPDPVKRVSAAHRRCFRFVLEGFEPERHHPVEGVLFPAAVWHKLRKLQA